MPKPSPKDITIPPRNYSCTACGRCCRIWHVYLLPEDRARLAKMTWPAEDDIPEKLTVRIGPHEYLAHRENGACIFLNESNNYCKIHSRYGYDQKPLGCKVYPYTITTTFPGQFGVTPRFDCPAVRDNDGKPIDAELGAIRGYIDDMGLTGGFDAGTLDDLAPDKARQLTEAIFRQAIGNRDLPHITRIIVAIMALDRLQIMGPVFLNDTDLRLILPSFFERVRTDLPHQKIRRLGIVEQWRFLSLLSGYLRRDEEIVHQGLGPRLKRTIAMAGIFFTSGNLHAFGDVYPNLRVDRRLLFGLPIANALEVDWSMYLDLVKIRLQAYQFLGRANYNLTYFVGLRSLLMTFPLVLAVAKCNALARTPGDCRILPEDVDYAVGAIDHSFGRSAYLSMGMFTTLTRQMTEPANYMRLVHALSS